jgi:hypothetical protein
MELNKGGCSTCTSLIRQCAGLDFFPQDVQVRKLLVERLHRLARNHDHAAAMIDRWLETQTAAPKVADLVSLAGDVRTDAKALPTGCEVCGEELWVVTDRGARRCGCARGLELRAMDIAREGERGSTTVRRGSMRSAERIAAAEW